MVTAALLGAAVVLFALGWLFVRNARRDRTSGEAFLRSATATQAQVVDMREKYRPRADSQQMPSYFPVVAFDLPDGRRVESEVMIGARPAPARIGATVEVRYDPADPRRVVLARGRATVGRAGCFATGLGVTLWVVGAFVVVLWVLLEVVLKVPG
jgi:Protein of unknown function (DUF3592)